jgi:bacteriophage N4 adsorption protein B
VLVAAIAMHERASGRSFAGVALHDSEDVIHPLELKLFNNLNDFYDFIQLPVYSSRALLAERGFLLRDMGDFVGARRDFLSAMKGYSR